VRRSILVLLGVLLLVPTAWAAPDEFDDSWTEEIVAGGITWLHREFDDLAGGWQRIDVLVVDPWREDLEIRPAWNGNGSCAPVSQTAQAHDALVAVNAGYFGGPCEHVGELQIAQEVLAPQSWENAAGRTSMGWTPYQGFRFETVAPGEHMDGVWHALGAGPRLIRDGEVAQEALSGFEGFSHGGQKHPRTAVAITHGGLMLLVTIDGRTGPLGMTFAEEAEFLIGLGVVDAMNLDGGGSTTMWLDGTGVVNVPSDGYERHVHSILAVVPTDGAPVADTKIGDRAVTLGETTDLDGTASDDPDNDPLTWHWRLAERPAGSVKSLTTGSVPVVPFTPDVEGQYYVELWVDDGMHVSNVHGVTINANEATVSEDIDDSDASPGGGSGLCSAAGGSGGLWVLAGLLLVRRGRCSRRRTSHG